MARFAPHPVALHCELNALMPLAHCEVKIGTPCNRIESVSS